MELFQSTSVWVLISFLIFVAFAYRKGRDGLLGMIDARIADIKKEIETAESLRIEAQELMAQYQRKLRDAKKESEQIISTAEKHRGENGPTSH